MATEDRGRTPSVEERLFQAPQRFGFFQAVRLLRLMLQNANLETPRSTREMLRFVSNLSLEFPASEIQDLTRPAEESSHEHEGIEPIEMTINFMGLTGPSGVLPTHYTETLISGKTHYRDSAAHRFFDLFGHRLVSLFASAWEKYHFFIGYERGDRENFTRYLLDIVGVGTSQLQGRLGDGEGSGVYDHALCYYSGLLSQRPHSGAALAAVIGDYFGTNATVTQFAGHWLKLPPSELTKLGKQNAALGESVMLGHRAWDHQGKFRVSLGPLSLTQLHDLLPSGNGHQALTRFIRFIAGITFDCEILLIVKREEVPDCKLRGVDVAGARLGWSSWLKAVPVVRDASERKSVPFTRDARDVILAT